MASAAVSNATMSIAPDGTNYIIPTAAEQRAEFLEIAQRARAARNAGQQIVVVQGLGFVGSAVAASVAAARDELGNPKHFVIGIDLARPDGYWKVAKVAAGDTPVVSPDETLKRLMYEGACVVRNLCATSCEDVYSLADTIIVDVPLSVHQRFVDAPEEITLEIDAFRSAIRTIGRHMRADALVLVETTVPAGATERIVQPILNEERQRRGLVEPLCLAHAYERVMPGARYVASIRSFFRSYAGIDKASAERAREFLASFIDTQHFPLRELSSPTASELGKLLENSYRATNIAFIHEWTLLAEEIGVNLFEVVDSIRVRAGTHDNMRYPGFGVGGYCLTKDSLLAQWAATQLFDVDAKLPMTLRAIQTNYWMPLHAVDLLAQMFDGKLSGRTIAVCGVSYLPGVADTRNSPTELFVSKLMEAGAELLVHDPCLRTWSEMPQVELQPELSDCFQQADAIVFAIPHVEYLGLTADEICAAGHKPFVLDAQNIINDELAAELFQRGCKLKGVGKGHWRQKGYA